MVKGEEKYFKTKYRPVGLLLKCLRYDVFILQLKIRRNESYSSTSIFVNFRTGWR